MSQQEKTTAKHSKTIEVQSKHNYDDALLWLEKWGKKQYGEHFKLQESDKPILFKLLCYFLKDEPVATKLGINLQKGILLSGPIGVGKTSIMNLMRLFEPAPTRHIMKSCRDVSFEFIKDGYEGTMLRNPNGVYKFGRSTIKEGYLIKYKDFLSDDAEIISIKEGILKYTGMLGSLIVKYKNNIVFGIGTGIEDNERLRLWKIKDSLIGKKVRFNFQDLSKKGVPRFPVYVGIRYD